MLVQALVQSLVPPQNYAKIAPRPRQDRPVKKHQFFIKNVAFSLGKCVNGNHKSVLHYVLKRDLAVLQKNMFFHWESVYLSADDARHCSQRRPCRWFASQWSTARSHAGARGCARVRALSACNDPSLCLFPGDRSRESCGTWQLPQIIIILTKHASQIC